MYVEKSIKTMMKEIAYQNSGSTCIQTQFGIIPLLYENKIGGFGPLGSAKNSIDTIRDCLCQNNPWVWRMVESKVCTLLSDSRQDRHYKALLILSRCSNANAKSSMSSERTVTGPHRRGSVRKMTAFTSTRGSLCCGRPPTKVPRIS